MSVLVSKKKLVQQVKIIYIQIEILKKYIIFKNYMSANKGSFWYLAATIWQYGGQYKSENPLHRMMMEYSIHKVSFLNSIAPKSF